MAFFFELLQIQLQHLFLVLFSLCVVYMYLENIVAVLRNSDTIFNIRKISGEEFPSSFSALCLQTRNTNIIRIGGYGGGTTEDNKQIDETTNYDYPLRLGWQ